MMLLRLLRLLLRLGNWEPIADGGCVDIEVGNAAVAAAAAVAVHSCCCCCVAAVLDEDATAAALDHLHRGVERVRRGRRGRVGRGRVVRGGLQEARGVGGGGSGGGGHAARHVAHSRVTLKW